VIPNTSRMQVKQFFFWKLLFFACLFIGSKPVSATSSDLSILCQQQATCKQLGAQQVPIFTVENIVPGESFDRVIEVKNDNKLHSCQLHLRLTETSGIPENALSEQLVVQVFHGKQIVLGTPSSGTTSLSIYQLQTEMFARYFYSLPPKTAADFGLVITFNPKADNKYQGTSAKTDITVAITCLQDDELSPIQETAITLPDPSVQATEVTLEPGCTTHISAEVPQLQLTRTETERGLVVLAWQPITGATEYWLDFGTEENSEQFRHRGIAATHYTVLDLDMTNDLFFRVQPVADCARGQYSNAVRIAGRQGKKVAVSTAPNQAQVLGSQEREITVTPDKSLPKQGSDQLLPQPNLVQYLTVITALMFFIWLLLRQSRKS